MGEDFVVLETTQFLNRIWVAPSLSVAKKTICTVFGLSGMALGRSQST
jgi:hypothetical protein